MKRFNWILCAASIAAVAAVAAPPAVAAHDVSFGVRAPVGDGDLFFSISSRYFDREPHIVRDWSRRFRNPDDLAVFFFIVNNSRTSPEQVYAIRQRGMPWYEVGRQSGMQFRSWYVDVRGVPGGRYARPYRYYGRYRDNPRYQARLSDREIRDLVAAKMAQEYYGVSPETAMGWRNRGSNVQVIMSREYRNRHGNDRDDRDRDHRRDGDDRYDHDRNDRDRNDRDRNDHDRNNDDERPDRDR